MPSPSADVAQRLARHAERVCRQYLSQGRKVGRYWCVGDVHNTPGGSLYVVLDGPRSGKWTDAATGEHGDLLDLIGLAIQASSPRDALAEARRFLGDARLPRPLSEPAPTDAVSLAQRLWRAARPLPGTLAVRYLTARGVGRAVTGDALRFLPTCLHRSPAGDHRGPALLAAVTDLSGSLTGVHRTWLRADGRAKAALDPPRKALGRLLGHGVRFAGHPDLLLIGEGIETVLAARLALPEPQAVAALSACHLAAFVWPPALRQMFVLRDRDPAGLWAAHKLANRAAASGLRVRVLEPTHDDFNTDLLTGGVGQLRKALFAQACGG